MHNNANSAANYNESDLSKILNKCFYLFITLNMKYLFYKYYIFKIKIELYHTKLDKTYNRLKRKNEDYFM
jgi:hypothetical protein